MLNTHLLEISESADWLDLETEADWNVWADRTGTSTSLTVAVTNGSHTITFSGSLGSAFIAANEGQTFIDDNSVEYTINRFTSTSVALLATPYGGTTRAALATWTIRCQHFLLPADCARPLRFIDRDNGTGPMVILDRRREEDRFAWDNATTGTVYWITDDDMVFDRAPDPGWSVTESTAAGSLAASAVYEYCYTLAYQGRESPPSVALRLETTTGATHQASIAGLEDTRVDGLATGIYKNIYRRLLLTSRTSSPPTEVYGRWLFVATITTESTTSYTDDDSPAASQSDTLALRYTNGRKFMRTRWIPGSDATIRIRYLRRPKRLVSDADVPWFREAYHDLLVYAAAADLGLQHSVSETKIARWEKRKLEMLGNMRATGLNVPDIQVRRQMRGDMGERDWSLYRVNGTVDSDFTG